MDYTDLRNLDQDGAYRALRQVYGQSHEQAQQCAAAMQQPGFWESQAVYDKVMDRIEKLRPFTDLGASLFERAGVIRFHGDGLAFGYSQIHGTLMAEAYQRTYGPITADRGAFDAAVRLAFAHGVGIGLDIAAMTPAPPVEPAAD